MLRHDHPTGTLSILCVLNGYSCNGSFEWVGKSKEERESNATTSPISQAQNIADEMKSCMVRSKIVFDIIIELDLKFIESDHRKA